jgi:hypothetical protein
MFGKVGQSTEISTSKLNLKAQNIHIKLLLKPLNKPWVETDCFSENCFCFLIGLNGEISPNLVT